MPEQSPVDLTSCDRGPIHLPGAIQPRGALLALHEPSLAIALVSENAFDILGLEVDQVLGQPRSRAFSARATPSARRSLPRALRW